MIEQWHNFIKRPEVCAHVVFLSDYDMQLAQEMVQGIDLWINTPLRPWEACGTSGMKVLVNGGLNLSELDGWWAEAYSCEVGWAIGDGRDHGDDPSLGALDAETLYDLLEQEIAPEFYERNDKGMPSRWLGRIRESMAQLTSRFSAGRALREYTEHYYIPAANDFRERASENSKLGIDLLRWQKQIAEKWSTIRIGTVDTETHDDQHFFRVQIFLGDLDPHELSVELYANAVQGGVPVREVMIACEVCSDPNSQTYLAKVPATRPTSDFTPRVIPYHANASVPLETEQILWER
jgi:starch phosphorylase